MTATAQNQISGDSYDAAGNLLGESACPASTYAYNAENQLTSTAGVTYTYDGDGKRVEKSSGTIYWYGLEGNVLDETDLSGNVTNEYVYFGGRRIARLDPSGNTFYYLADHLGTSRVIAEVPSGSTTASPCYDADFYPFGGERAYTNTCAQNYKFTGKERDPESNLDNFGARYFTSSMGRFMSPDWSAKPQGVPYAQLADPQSLNLYLYVRDNPLGQVDVDGHDYLCVPCVEKAISDYLSSPGGKQTAKGIANMVIGGGLIATAAGGDVPGGAAGALLVASAGMGAASTFVSGATDALGGATRTNTADTQKALDATSNLLGLAATATATAATGDANKGLAIGNVVATATNAASLVTAPKEAVKNPATAADAAETVGRAVDLVKRGQGQKQQHQLPPPPPPPCNGGGCGPGG